MDTFFTPTNCSPTTAINAIHRHTSVSTNSELMTLVTSGHLKPTHIHRLTADTQTAGRGQHSRQWLSPLGNVYLSLFVPIGSAYPLWRLTGLLSPIVGLCLLNMPLIVAINDILKQNNRPAIGVKWANDLGFYADECVFYKLAGILIEAVVVNAKTVGVVIGVGVNVNNSPVITDGLYCACCLGELVAQNYSLPMLYEQISHACLCACQWHNGMMQGDGWLAQRFIDDYNANHVLSGRYIGIFEQNNTTPTKTGICGSIAPDGALCFVSGERIVAGMARRLQEDK